MSALKWPVTKIRTTKYFFDDYILKFYLSIIYQKEILIGCIRFSRNFWNSADFDAQLGKKAGYGWPVFWDSLH